MVWLEKTAEACQITLVQFNNRRKPMMMVHMMINVLTIGVCVLLYGEIRRLALNRKFRQRLKAIDILKKASVAEAIEFFWQKNLVYRDAKGSHLNMGAITNWPAEIGQLAALFCFKNFNIPDYSPLAREIMLIDDPRWRDDFIRHFGEGHSDAKISLRQALLAEKSRLAIDGAEKQRRALLLKKVG